MAQISPQNLADTPLYRLTAALSRWFVVSILWLVCSLPIVTLGAATKASLAVFTPEECAQTGTTQKFFRAFRDGFGRVTVLWFLTLALMVLLGMDVLFYRHLSGGSGAVLTGIVLLLGNLLLNFFRFGCFCAAETPVGFGALLQKAGLTMLGCLPVVGIFAAMDLFLFVTLVNIPYLLFLIVILPGLLACAHSRLIRGFRNRATASH